MQEARIIVPNSYDIENKVYELASNELGYCAPVTKPTLILKLVRGLNKEYGIKLKGVNIEGQNALRIAGIVQARLFKLQSAQDKTKPSRHPKIRTNERMEVATVIATALNERYGRSQDPYDIINVTVKQLCDRIVYLHKLYNKASTEQ